MGNTNTRNQNLDTNISSDQIKSNIKNLFKINANADKNNDYYTDTIGWNKIQSGGKSFVTVKRYEQYRNQSTFLMGGHYDNQHNTVDGINNINMPSEMLTDSSIDTAQLNDLKNLYTKQFKYNPHIPDLEKKPQNTAAKLQNIVNNMKNISNPQNQDNNDIISQDSQIEQLKNLIKSQIGGNCGCGADFSISPSQPINLSVLKGGAKDKNKKKDDEDEDEIDDNMDDEYEEEDEDIEDDDEDEDEDDEDDEDEEEEEDEESYMGRMTEDEVSESANPRARARIINAVPFYSSDEAISAGTYFKHLNRDKF